MILKGIEADVDQKGKPLSDEQKRKMSVTMKRKYPKWSKERREKQKQYFAKKARTWV